MSHPQTTLVESTSLAYLGSASLLRDDPAKSTRKIDRVTWTTIITQILFRCFKIGIPRGTLRVIV